MSLGNKQQNGNTTVVSTDRQQITALTKVVFMIYGGLQFVCLMLLGWKAYDPQAWLPMPPVSTFISLVVAFAIFWFLWLNAIEVLKKKT